MINAVNMKAEHVTCGKRMPNLFDLTAKGTTEKPKAATKFLQSSLLLQRREEE